MRPLDLKGQKFGKLTPVEVVKIGMKRGWKCRCDCGNYIEVPTFQLTSKNNTSCGCGRSKVQQGDRFGMLVVQKILYVQNNKSDIRLQAEVQCDCGTIKKVFTRNLTRMSTTHCGCKKKENYGKGRRLEFGVSARNRLIMSYKHNAKNKNIDYNLSNDEIIELFKGNCYYCGVEPSSVTKAKSYGTYTYNGIDRLDSTNGYVTTNVVSCCSTCNYLKNKYSEIEFLTIIMKIANHRGIQRIKQTNKK